MRFKAVYDKDLGFVFPDLDNELQYEVYKERIDGKFKTLIKGIFNYGEFYLEYSQKLNLLLISYGEVNEDNDITKAKIYLYRDLDKALEDFKQLESKPNSRWWKTPYYEKDFIQDYVDPKLDYSKMKWRKKGVLWVAQGTNGKFSIRHLHRKYIGKYEGKKGFTFNMPPTPTISKMKENCKLNAYWEK